MIRMMTLFLFSGIALFGPAGGFAESKAGSPQDLNANPMADNPRHYSVAIRFSSIESVTVSTMRSVESLGIPHEKFTLQEKEWRYDQTSSILFVDRDIDPERYIVRVTGKYITPLCIHPSDTIDPVQIRFVIENRVGVAGKDYIYDQERNEIRLVSCTTGDEKYILEYGQPGGMTSVGSMSASDMVRPIRAYLGWPVDGNSRAVDQKGSRFSPLDGHYKSVWLVQLLPVADGYPGKDILTGFTWDSKANELTLDEGVDPKRFSVFIMGEEEQ